MKVKVIYFPGFLCFVPYWAEISGERLQDHWSSGFYLLFGDCGKTQRLSCGLVDIRSRFPLTLSPVAEILKATGPLKHPVLGRVVSSMSRFTRRLFSPPCGVSFQPFFRPAKIVLWQKNGFV